MVRQPRLMRRSAWWVGWMVAAVGCAAPPFDSRPATPPAVLAAASGRWPSATLSLAEVEGASGEPAAALELARELRRARPRGLAARRAGRLAERLRATHPELPFDHADEAEMRLKEGDARGAREQAEMALAGAEPLERARILWVGAQAGRALGRGQAAEATCIELARETSEPLAPRALTAAAGPRCD